MRTGRSAHPPAAEHWGVRGRPRPHSGPAQGSMRTGRSAHPPPPNTGRCADVLVRIPARHKVQCGPGGPRTPRRRTLGGARTSSSAFRPGARFNADREVRAPPRRRTPGGARTSSSAFGLVQGSMRTGRSAHPPPRRRTLGGARTSSSAFRPGTRFNADREVRAPPHRRTPGGARTSSSAFRPGTRAQCGPGGPRTPPAAEPREVRGRPRPHSGPAQGSMRTGRSAHRPPPNTGRCADVLVRIPARHKVQCGPGGPRTPPPPNTGRCADVLVRIPAWHKVQCGPGGPRTPPPPNTGRCADVLVRIRPGARFNADRRRTLGGARTASSAFGAGARFNSGREARVPSRV